MLAVSSPGTLVLRVARLCRSPEITNPTTLTNPTLQQEDLSSQNRQREYSSPYKAGQEVTFKKCIFI